MPLEDFLEVVDEQITSHVDPHRRQHFGLHQHPPHFTQGNIYRDDFWDVLENRFQEYRDRSWARTGPCEHCEAFKFCLGGGMHQRGDNRELVDCLYLHLKKD